MTWKRDIDTGLILRKRTTNILCNTCCFVPTYSAYNCCCFLDPSPDAYYSGTLYALWQAASYDGFNWYSLKTDNINHTPTVGGGWWEKYTDCGNTNWNSITPFGGIGKSPQYYAVSAKISYDSPYGANRLQIWMTVYFILSKYTLNFNCEWSGNVIATFTYSHLRDGYLCTGSGTTYASCGLILYNTYAGNILTLSVGSTSCRIYRGLNCSEYDDITIDMYLTSDACILKGYATRTISVITLSASWRPPDCDYTVYSTTYNYNLLDCVVWAGKFWKCCRRNGPVYGIHEPTGDFTDCSEDPYWRVV